MKVVIIDTETTGVKKDSNILEIGLVYYNTETFNSISSIKNAPKLSLLIHRKELNHCQLGAIKLNSNLIKEITDLSIQIAPGADEYRVVKPTMIEVTKDNTKVMISDPEYVMNIIYYWLIENNIVDLTNYGVKKYKTVEDLKKALDSNAISFDDLKYYLQPVTFAGKNIATFDIPILLNDIPKFNEFKYRYRMIDPSILYTSSHDTTVPPLQECLNRLKIDEIIPTTTKHRAVDDCLDVAYLLYFHFKQTRYRTYVAFEIDNFKLVSKNKITLNLDSESFEKDLEKFKEDNKGKLISYDMSFHTLGALGRLDSFHTELTHDAIPLEIQALKRFEGEIVIDSKTIIDDFKTKEKPIYNALKFINDNLDDFTKDFIKVIQVDYFADKLIIKPDETSITVLSKESNFKAILDNVLNAYSALFEKAKQEKTK